MLVFKKIWPYLIILIIILAFFAPVLKGQVPFPGDYLIDQNPYRTSSFLGYGPGGYPNKGQGIDVVTEIYPWRYFSAGQFKNAQIPFWDPYNFSGNPLLANFQTAVFYPLNFFYFVFPFNFAWTLIIMLQPFLAAIFLYLYLSKGLKLSKTASLLGGITFGFSSYMVVWLQYGNIGNTFLWLPLILLFIKKLSEKLSALNFLFLTIAFLMSFLGGYIQGFFYIVVISVLFLFLLTLFKECAQKIKKISVFFLSLIISLMLTSFQSLSTYQLFLNSTRGSYSLSQISNLLLPPYYLITFFFSDFFGNQSTRNYWLDGTYIERVMYIGVAFSLFVFYAVKKVKLKEKWFFLIVAVLSLILATNLPFIKFFYLLPIPVISTTVPTRELSIFIFSTIILGSMGIDHWLKNKNDKSKIPFFYIGFYVLVIVVISLAYKFNYFPALQFKVTIRNTILPTILALATVLIFFFKDRFKKVMIVLLFTVIIFDLFYFFNKITPFSPQELIYPQVPVISFLKNNAGINRYWGYGNAYIPSNFQTVDQTFSPEGNDPLHINRYGELLASSRNGQLPVLLPRPDANIASGFAKEDLKNNFYRKRILDLLGVKFILYSSPNSYQDNGTFPENQYKLIWTNLPWQIYENKDVLPRYFLAGDYIVKNTKQDILSNIYNSKLDLFKTLILEENPKIPIDKSSTGAAALISYTPNKITFKTETNGNLLLFLSDNYFSDWKATVDGKSWSLQRADYTFRAVPIPKGKHIITMVYDPEAFDLGLKIAGVGILIFIFSFVYLRIYEKKI